ncbi:MAG TPA: NUDIX hydrolase [Steroidobacteraceae bacterium]|nr:NUDIX hydrolase [Steroidobacteraceae bacterium]
MIWKPDVTVAAITERDGRFLFVEERVRGRVVINQPAGHLEDGESFLEAVVRETLEETGWDFEPRAVVGVYLWRPGHTNRSFLRVAFAGELSTHDPTRPLDRGILRTRWMTREELAAAQMRLRSPLVLRCVEDYLAGARYPCALLNHLISEPSPVAAQG